MLCFLCTSAVDETHSAALVLTACTVVHCSQGGLLSTIIAGSCPGITAANPGLQKLIFAALFPANLLLILMTGGQLFTGNAAAVPAALFEGLVTFDELIKSWITSFVGNLIGCNLFVLAAWYTGLLPATAKELAVATVGKKVAGDFLPTLVKAIGCNWLVCMAVLIAGAANDLAGKMVGIWYAAFTPNPSCRRAREHLPQIRASLPPSLLAESGRMMFIWQVPHLHVCRHRARALSRKHVLAAPRDSFRCRRERR